MMRRTLIAMVVLLQASTALADKKPTAQQLSEAKKHYERGQKLHDEGRYKEAIPEYQAAYDLVNRPLLLFNIGQAYRLAGDKRNAVSMYQRYLHDEPGGKVAAEANAFVAVLTSELEREDTRVRSQTADDEWRGAVEGSSLRGVPPPAAPLVERDIEPSGGRERGRALRIGGLATGGAGVALLGVGTIFALRARSLSNQQYDGDPYDPTLVDDGKVANRNAIIAFVAGGAAVATGGILYYLGYRQGHEARLTVLPGPASVTVAGRF